MSIVWDRDMSMKTTMQMFWKQHWPCWSKGHGENITVDKWTLLINIIAGPAFCIKTSKWATLRWLQDKNNSFQHVSGSPYIKCCICFHSDNYHHGWEKWMPPSTSLFSRSMLIHCYQRNLMLMQVQRRWRSQFSGNVDGTILTYCIPKDTTIF
jgi:hypothetical protein